MFSRFSTMFHNVRIPGGSGGDRRVGGNGNNGGGGSRPPTPSSSTYGSYPKKSRSDRGGKTGPGLQAVELDNSAAVISKIAHLYAERLLSDITLVINGAEYPAHRLILCASSDVFQVMLMNPNWNEAKESKVVLQESVECAQIFENFLKYLYTGGLKLELQNVLHVLILADKYNVKDLISLCLSYMEIHIPVAAQHSQLILWLQYASNFGEHHAKIAECCRNYLKWNLESVSKAEDFPHLEPDLFTSILRQDDVVVFDEYRLYQIVEYWLMCRTEKGCESDLDAEMENEVSKMVYQTMQHIRFPMMNPRQIADLIQSPLIRTCEPVIDLMAMAMNFHNGCIENDVDMVPSSLSSLSSRHRQSLSSSRNPNYKFFTPRLYCTDQWSVCMVTPFDKLQHYQAQTLVFATPCSFSELLSKSDKQIEWCLDFYPKAVQFQKFCLIGWHETTEMPDHILKTVRLSVVCRSEGNEDVRVHIGILIAGSQDGVEHVRKVVNKNHIFSERDRVLNIDDLLPYGDLNPCAQCVARNRVQHPSGTSSSRMGVGFPPASPSCPTVQSDNYNGELHQNNSNSNTNSCWNCHATELSGTKSCFLIGDCTIKIRIAITPLP